MPLIQGRVNLWLTTEFRTTCYVKRGSLCVQVLSLFDYCMIVVAVRLAFSVY